MNPLLKEPAKLRRALAPRPLALPLVLLALALTTPRARAEAPLWTERPASATAGLAPDAPVSMRAFADLARALSPAVVAVHITRAAPSLPFRGGPEGSGQGSGFIIRGDGLVLTNHHVIRDASDIRVRLIDESEHAARVVGAFPPLDVALLRFDPPSPLPVAPLGDARALDIGEWVVAIGNPFGLGHTVTAGIVSAKGRRDVVPAGREPNMAPFIQTDASINPGNSGGPLINIRGEVVGINTAINAAGQGIGFAVPIDMVKTILPQLARGRVDRSFLGLRFGPVPPEVRAGREDLRRGALVREVVAGGPAARAGIAQGDIITRWDGVPLRDWEEMAWLAATAGAGRAVDIGLARGGRELSLRVTLDRFPETDAPTAGADAPSAAGGVAAVGLTVRALTTAEARAERLAVGVGVVVTAVADGSPAAILGVRAGDVIVTINRREIRGGPAAFDRLVQEVADGELLAFGVKRGDRFLMRAYTR
jgi:S1-C subfamily serine protease